MMNWGGSRHSHEYADDGEGKLSDDLTPKFDEINRHHRGREGEFIPHSPLYHRSSLNRKTLDHPGTRTMNVAVALSYGKRKLSFSKA